MIPITTAISLEECEIEERFIRSPGPGGQKVNKTETGVQLRFNARQSPALSHATFVRLRTLAGRRMTVDGIVVISATRFRTQEQNRRDAMVRLAELIGKAVQPRKRRRATKPTKASVKRRLEAKKHRSNMKKGRAGWNMTNDRD